MKNWLKNLLINLPNKLKCHPECPLENPCHCNICGFPNDRWHFDKTHKRYEELGDATIPEYHKAFVDSFKYKGK